MSFSYKVKEELCSIVVDKCCAAAELYGVFLFANTFSPKGIKVITENKALVDRICNHCNRLFSFKPEIIIRQTRKGETFYVSINREEHIHRLHLVLGVNLTGISLSIDYKIFQSECCMSSFVRGAFLAGGTLTSPDKAYHMEFATPRLRLSKDFMNLLSELDLAPKIITRKANHVIYFKDSALIEDVLNIMGATKSEFELINAKILKEIRNSVNRVTNCETANISKMVQAAGEQIKAIKKIMSRGKFDDLPEELKEIANKRLQNEELSLNELGLTFEPALSKSALNNRLRKIIEFSKKI